MEAPAAYRTGAGLRKAEQAIYTADGMHKHEAKVDMRGSDFMRKALALLAALLLAGCVDASATYYIDGSDHALTLRAVQEHFWDDQVALTLVASRWPECQRSFALTQLPVADAAIELFASGDNTWTLRADEQLWQVETRTCTLQAEPANHAPGERLGKFELRSKALVFEEGAAEAGNFPAAAPH